MNTIQDFHNLCTKNNITLSDQQITQFQKYYELLIEWNEKINLTAITDFHEVCLKHFYDSIALVHYLEFKESDFVLDIGTGAGFPGIPLKILFPNTRFVLADSLNKRLTFLDEVIQKLELEKIELVHGRAEDLGHDSDYREQFDYCVSRAVANLSTLSELCLPFVKVGGQFISYKSEHVKDEINQADHALAVLNGKIDRQEDYTLPDSDFFRSILFIRKEDGCPNQYPRKAGKPNKNPL